MKIIHTSDWQIGKVYRFVDDEACVGGECGSGCCCGETGGDDEAFHVSFLSVLHLGPRALRGVSKSGCVPFDEPEMHPRLLSFNSRKPEKFGILVRICTYVPDLRTALTRASEKVALP